MLKEGLANPDKAASAASQLAAVRSIAGSPSFNAMRGKCVTSFYANDIAFAVFGYSGSSREKKDGYITCGFEILKWLPAPPTAASPAQYTGWFLAVANHSES